ncbi:MAG: protein kinase, partial [Pseudomonadota bacterium]
MSKEKHTEPDVGYPPGTVFGDTYRINQLVGLGGMGEVYEVEHLRTHGKLALKVLNPMYSVDDQAIERFRREAQMAAGVDHESIVHVFDVDQDSSGVWFIAMELLEGQTLKEILTREKVLTIRRALWIADRVSKALASVHEKGIVHRDIKPANIFLSKAGTIVQVKIMDFGVSKFAHSQSRLSIGLVVGTPRYMSPEQACGEDQIDHRVDIFSLAAVIYRALAGVGPFDARTAPEVLDRILTRDPPPPSHFNSEVTRQMDWAIMKALSKDPERRFGSIDLFRDALCRDQKFTGAFKLPPGGVADLSMSSVMTAPQMSAEAFREMRRVTILSVSIDAEAYKAGGHGRSNSFYETVADHVGQMQRIIEAHGGMVEKTFTGSMIAVFGAPKSKVDDALQAVRAALSLKHALSKQDLILRIGLSTGRVMAGRLIDEDGRYSVTGGALNLARRIEGVNDTGGVLVDQETYVQIRGRFRTKLITIMEGREEERRTRGPVTVYEVTGEHAFGFVVGYREVLGMYAVTVGRDAELEHLKAQLHRSLESGVVETALIVAPGGMGKSRLVNELRAYVEDSSIDPYTLMAEGNSQTSDIPFALLTETIKTKAQISSKDDASVMKSKLKDFVSAAQDSKIEQEDFINQTYSMVLHIEPARQDNQDIGSRLKVAVRDHLEATLKQAPVLIIMEDLQWADEKSMEVLFSVADNIKPAQLFILGTASPDVFDRFNSAQFMGFWQNVMKLKPLSRKESEELIRSIMRSAPPPRLVEHIFEISEGNPLFIEEFLQSLADRGLLVYGDDCWQILDRGWRDILPGGVEAVIQSRLDELKRDELNLMRKAAVIGSVFWDKALEALGEKN